MVIQKFQYYGANYCFFMSIEIAETGRQVINTRKENAVGIVLY